MLKKQLNESGQKSFQRKGDNEDRSLIYRNWLRTVDTNGFWMDLDLIKFRKNNDGVPLPVAITDITRTDKDEVGRGYLEAIEDRIYNRDKQAKILLALGDLLKIPVYLVLFPKNMLWVWVLSIKARKWKNFTPLAWSKFLRNL